MMKLCQEDTEHIKNKVHILNPNLEFSPAKERWEALK